MNFETLECHNRDHRYCDTPIVWREPADTVDEAGRADIRPWRECSYCGSMHPLDFVALHERLKFIPWHVAEANRKGPPSPITGEPTIDVPYCEMADRKYGFPHKVYVTTLEVVHPDREFVTGTTWVDGKPVTTHRSKGHSLHGKFYTQHFLEEKLDQELFEKVATAVGESTGWWFTRDPKTLQIHYSFKRT